MFFDLSLKSSVPMLPAQALPCGNRTSCPVNPAEALPHINPNTTTVGKILLWLVSRMGIDISSRSRSVDDKEPKCNLVLSKMGVEQFHKR